MKMWKSFITLSKEVLTDHSRSSKEKYQSFTWQQRMIRASIMFFYMFILMIIVRYIIDQLFDWLFNDHSSSSFIFTVLFPTFYATMELVKGTRFHHRMLLISILVMISLAMTLLFLSYLFPSLENILW